VNRIIDGGPLFSAFVSVLIILLAIAAIASGKLPFQLLGGFALICAGAMIVGTFLMSDLPGHVRQLLGLPPKPRAVLLPMGTVHCTMGERLVPIVLTVLAILAVGAAAVYTAWMMGLW
jgi:hypothetical protein